MPITRSRRTALICLVVAACAAVVLSAQRAGRGSAAGSLVITDTTLIDGTGVSARPHVTIVIRDGHISKLIPAGSPTGAPEGTPTLDGAGRYAIPGLIDAHVHLAGSTWEQRADQLRRALQGGVTTVFDLAGDARINGDLARAVAVGEIEGPHIYYCALLAGPVFFSDPRVLDTSRGYPPGEAPFMHAVGPDTDLVRTVAAAKGSGASAIKLYAALDGPTVARITAEAHRQGIRVVAHATVFPAKPSEIVDAGVDMVAHAAYLVWEGSPATPEYSRRTSGDFAGVPVDSPAIEQLLQSMRAHGTALNPTLWIFAEGTGKDALSPERIPWQNAVTRRAAQLGIPIVAGTDRLLNPQVDTLPILHRELEQLVSGAGLTPMQALQAATKQAAKSIGVDSALGTLEEGRAADLLLLSGDPLIDIKHTRDIVAVVAGGRIIQRAGQ